MKDLIQEIRELDERQEQAALATIVSVEGSAYRREGAKMILTRSGRHIGTLSGGCLESDLAERIESILQSGIPQVFTYDTTADDDLVWGLGSGCNGKVQVLVEPLAWPQRHPAIAEPYWHLLERLLAKRVSVAAVRQLGDAAPGPRLLYTSEGEIWGAGDEDSDLQRFLVEQCLEVLSRKPRKPILAERNGQSFFFDYFEPRTRLYVFGAGVDAEPVIRLAEEAGFATHVIDPRPARCNVGHFSASDHLLIAHPEEVLDTLEIDGNDFAVIMNHHFERDQTILNRLLQQKPYYLGVLGPRRRTAKLLGAETVPEEIHSPIGLSIGAEGPEEIAISIVAELIAARSKKKNSFA